MTIMTTTVHLLCTHLLFRRPRSPAFPTYWFLCIAADGWLSLDTGGIFMFSLAKRIAFSKVSAGLRYHRRKPLQLVQRLYLATKSPHDRWIDIVVRVFGSIFYSCTPLSIPTISAPLSFLFALSSQNIPEIKVFLIRQILESKFVSLFLVECVRVSSPILPS